MSFGRREPAWRRNQERRADREREVHEARRRRLAGLAPLPPREGVTYRAMEDTTATTFTIPSMHNSFIADAYRYYISGNQVSSIANHWPLSDMNRVVVSNSPGTATIMDEAKKMPTPEREPEPTAMEAWRD